MTVRAKKHLGQHFLKDERIALRIADALSYSGYDLVLEVGPGMGVLTQYLMNRGMEIQVIELDRESVGYLTQHFPDLKGKIIYGDFLKVDLRELMEGRSLALVGNFPYNISSQILFKAIENRDLIPEFCGMFQKEVARRIAEKPGTKTYGILSVLTQAFFEVEYLFTVPPSVFDPPPKVDSGVIRLKRKSDYNLPVDPELFFKVVKTAFNQRRKTLRNSLKSMGLSQKSNEDAIFAKRPEQLSVAEFIDLTEMIARQGDGN